MRRDQRQARARSGETPHPVRLVVFAFLLSLALAAPARAAEDMRAAQMMIDPEHPQWLMRKGAGPLMICGTEEPEVFLDLGRRDPDGTRHGNQVRRIRKLIEHGGNGLHLQVVRTHGGEDSGARPAAPKPFEWEAATPESQGISSRKLDALKEGLAARGTRALLIIRDDKIISEWYAPGHSATSRHGTASLAKAIVGGLSLAVAMDDGRIALDDPAARFIPQWQGDPRKSRITIRQLGSHTSGLADAEAAGKKHEELTGWEGEFWKRLDPPNDPFTLSRDRTPLIFEPGASRQYSNPGIAMMSYAVTAALRDAPVKDVRTLLRDRIMRPIGVPDAEWACGYGKTFTVDGLPLIGSWGGGNYTARAAARIGRLMLRQGDWEGTQLLGREAVRQTTGSSGLPGAGGMGWWTNAQARCPELPADAYWGAGAGGQVLLVAPSLKLIVVRNGGSLDAGDNDVAIRNHLFTPLMGIFAGKASEPGAGPPPPSPVIRGIAWAPRETIVRRAKGSDNWPLTWADDDALYGAYGDGNGFEPFTPEKLSLGLARISGGPKEFAGENLRAPTLEAKGDDSRGVKASGLLMVDGVLYLWGRNAGNARLAWSADHGRTWTWSGWRWTESFGAPTFVNFGRNYAGARDAFVYVVSHDAETAYQTADGFVLARAPKDQLRDRAAWQYFAGLKESRPVWSPDAARRRPILTAPGRCYRASVSYHAALKRYLLVHPVPSAASRDRTGRPDTRFAGGLAVLDAPEPWGPWTTAFSTEEWDVGPGETSSFPTKWMDGDGTTLHLVFSGDDHFSVRGATLKLANPSKPGEPNVNKP